ncbi:hypothetical protein EK21DRAFT_108752 [Setomelanomma holmii]|uniref:Uncharacterized protein n=1 Tax=Setomelanomma holmii TaxID=210430 RepID=A0A9P4HG43_9PLEO|nr:hypothetical protein EK21DRAFT_108752 [Setomelanomma holmii]
MDYYDPDECIPRSPGLTPVKPGLGHGGSMVVPFPPSWQPEDIQGVPLPLARTPSVYFVGKPRKYLFCDINHEIAVATPDSGSEVDLMSPYFALERGFTLHPAKESIELANGAVVDCNGFVRTTMSIGSHFDSNGAPRSKSAAIVDFFLLEGLHHDVIVGEHHLAELTVFTDNKHALINSTYGAAVDEVNRIRHLGTVDKALS